MDVIGFVVLDVDKVISACERYIANCEKYTTEKREALISERIEQSEKSFFRKLFRLPVITREKAIKEYESDIWTEYYWWVVPTYDIEVLLDSAIATKNTGKSEMYVSCEIARLLGKFL